MTFTAWKIRCSDGSETMSSNAKSFAAFNGIRSARRKRLTEAREGLPTSFFGFNSNGKISGLFDFVFVVLQRDTATGSVCNGIGDAAAMLGSFPVKIIATTPFRHGSPEEYRAWAGQWR
ncbi:hypothetical protein [Rathayibacter toxicus]|uniref:hypothetical protein n=1 Tax=Rathayibacter toxicus TaxID=145458 RepID=UPI0011B03D96|nr:hypothetical protein [Rathayibacter toxicus]QOD08026.1 hypothetical protein AYW78_09240 [Rathayibacter toxicus]QWL26689.1 hypothetical protein E2R32_09080 [Rathayibacter toxicus]QWL49738.1 hypothetical protein E2R43_09060 [Rathayibacter toxicus]QWL51795.1 hypothetical protein E2R44_09090 [Rathayibacter toxicus]QWL54137.1 hypothetical protein E2R45_09065 [Rathayibacter toxicus]